jgi:hypothetical protein
MVFTLSRAAERGPWRGKQPKAAGEAGVETDMVQAQAAMPGSSHLAGISQAAASAASVQGLLL